MPEAASPSGSRTPDSSRSTPGERPFTYSGDALARQVPYVAAVVESTLPAVVGMTDASTSLIEQGLEDLRALPSTPGSAMGWDVHKAHARR